MSLESAEVIKSREVKENNRKTQSIILASYIGSILSWIAFIIAAVVFYTSPTLTPDKRVFFVSILAVVAIGLQIVSLVVKSEPVYLNIFTLLTVAISFLTAGISISFL
jgi:heme/copper-type cytochrome/quinol oxidase subunit 4